MNSHHASFRDPAGYVFHDNNGRLRRHITEVGAADFALLHSSGLYDALVADNLLIPHKVVKKDIIEPEFIPFISYPFEWSFSQLKDAALLTLAVQKKAMAHGMVLKDASAYNVQFKGPKPVFIDTLSFEAYRPGTPWKAYKQFCQHFLAPLALMAHADVRLGQLLRVHLDGVPLDLAARLLPRRTMARPGLAMHMHLHARAQLSKADSAGKAKQVTLSQAGLEAVIASLHRTVAGLKLSKVATEWGNYYTNTNYTAKAADAKAALVSEFVQKAGAKTVLDLGGNDGSYSRPLHAHNITTICADADPNAVDYNYLQAKKDSEAYMLPLLIDLTNPGGALGWANKERASIAERLHVDLVLALALVHHLAISNNLPLERIANYFAEFAPYLVIEFVPKEDSQVQKLLATRDDIFPRYTKAGFEAAFSTVYTLVQQKNIPGTKRTLFTFKRQ